MEARVPADAKVVDATNLIVGRMSSIVARRLLRGENIVIINTGKAVFSGRKSAKLKKFEAFLHVVGRSNPKYGPKHPRRPDTVLRRVIRGMLPMDREKGRKAFKRLRVFIDCPPTLAGKEVETIKEASAGKLKCGYVTLEKISREIGWKG